MISRFSAKLPWGTVIVILTIFISWGVEQSAHGGEEDTYRSKSFKVQIRHEGFWKDACTYGFAKKSITGWENGLEAGVHFSSFSADGPTQVRIQSLKTVIQSYDITPRTLRSRAVSDGNGLTITLKPLEKAWITLNGDEGDPLFLFCNPPKTPVPRGSIYFGPGIHRLKAPCRPGNGQSIYLDDGAWVVGQIDLRGRNHVNVTGQGVLSGEWGDGILITKEQQKSTLSMILGDQDPRSTGNLVEGIIVVDSPAYNFLAGPDHITNVKLISPWSWSTDGFQMIPRGKGTARIENCFAFIGDDVFFPRENFRGDIEIRDCLVGTCNNSIFQLCYWGETLRHYHQAWIHNITVKSLMKGQGAIFRASLDRNDHHDTGFKNMIFENICIENGLQVPLIQIENRPYYFGGKTYASCGNSSHIVFRNITVEGPVAVQSTLLGRDALNGHRDYLFEKVTINGVLIERSNFGQFLRTNGFTAGIRFQQ
jgi:hypothetical protein